MPDDLLTHYERFCATLGGLRGEYGVRLTYRNVAAECRQYPQTVDNLSTAYQGLTGMCTPDDVQAIGILLVRL